ncbi:MAG: hypothetical protein WAY02_09445 [Burkholderiaceae bacterium]
MDEAIAYASRFWNPGKRDERLMEEAVRGYLIAQAARERRQVRRMAAGV